VWADCGQLKRKREALSEVESRLTKRG
jgi:hypothetical protein